MQAILCVVMGKRWTLAGKPEERPRKLTFLKTVDLQTAAVASHSQSLTGSCLSSCLVQFWVADCFSYQQHLGMTCCHKYACKSLSVAVVSA